MTDQDIKQHIAALHAELDVLLWAGDRESLMRSIALMEQTWQQLLNKDDGLRYMGVFQNIWMDEMVRGEPSIFAGVRSVADVLEKHRLIRHAFFRLENDWPPEPCLEALQTLSAMQLSNTAFRVMLGQCVEDGEKVLTRINEIAKGSP